MDFRPNILIAWPKATGCEEIIDSQLPSSQNTELEKYRLERVIYVDLANNELWAIDVNDRTAWPKFYPLSELSTIVSTDQARIIVNHETHQLITLPDEELESDFAKYIKYRDEAWELIKPLVMIEVRKVFSRRTRGPLIAVVAKATGRDKNKVRFYLR
jgi:hypothetical protein